MNEVFDVVTENNFQLKDSFQKTKFPCKTNNGQFALPHIDLTFRIETPGTLQRTNSFNPFKYKLKKHFSNELKNSNNFFWIYFHFQLLASLLSSIDFNLEKLDSLLSRNQNRKKAVNFFEHQYRMNQCMLFADFLMKYYPVDTQKPEPKFFVNSYIFYNSGHFDLHKKIW